MSFGTQEPREAFGRRVGGAPPPGARRTGAAAPEFEARYSWRVNWLAVTLLVTAFTTARDLMSPSDMRMLPLTSFDPLLMWFAVGLTTVIALIWLWQGLAGTAALSADARGLSGFTLLGRKRISWGDIDSLQLKKHETYGQELIIHAKRGSPSSSIWLNAIPVAIDKVDRSLDEMVSAIRKRRPDLSV